MHDVDADRIPPRIDTSVPQLARVYDYWLGGKNNYAADRAVAQRAIELMPQVLVSVRENRAFLARAVRYLVAECGIRQLLDIGTGLPADNNTHEVAQSIAPESRIVYVDNDPIVLVHAQALLTSSPEGHTDYLEEDLRRPEKILRHARTVLDFTQPIGLMLLGVLHAIDDEDDPWAAVRTLTAALPSGSYLAISHLTIDPIPGETSIEVVNDALPVKLVPRSHADVERFFDGWDLVDPGVVTTTGWRFDPDRINPGPMPMWCGVGRKP